MHAQGGLTFPSAGRVLFPIAEFLDLAYLLQFGARPLYGPFRAVASLFKNGVPALSLACDVHLTRHLICLFVLFAAQETEVFVNGLHIFIGGKSQQKKPERGDRDENAAETVEHPAMAGKVFRGIFFLEIPFHQRHQQIAHLREDADDEPHENTQIPRVCRTAQHEPQRGTNDKRGHKSGNASLDGFIGADVAEMVPAP